MRKNHENVLRKIVQSRINNKCKYPGTKMGLPFSKAKKKAGVSRTINERIWKKKWSEVGRAILYGFLWTIRRRSFDFYFIVK